MGDSSAALVISDAIDGGGEGMSGTLNAEGMAAPARTSWTLNEPACLLAFGLVPGGGDVGWARGVIATLPGLAATSAGSAIGEGVGGCSRTAAGCVGVPVGKSSLVACGIKGVMVAQARAISVAEP